MVGDRVRRGIEYRLFQLLVTGLVAAPLLAVQEKADPPTQRFTGYPPSVYMHTFLACTSHASCAQTDSLRVDQVPDGCCLLIITNGDGRGTDEVRTYEVFLNGERVIPADHSPRAKVPVKLRPSNTLKIILTGQPQSKVFVLLTYDPRQSR